MSKDDVCTDALKAMYLDWCAYYKRHGSPRSDKKLKECWRNWNRTENLKVVKSKVKKVCG